MYPSPLGQTLPPTYYENFLAPIIRQEIDKALAQRQQPAVPPAMAQILVAVESGLSFPEQHFLAANVGHLPQYLQSPDGKALVKMLVEGLGKMLAGGNGSGANTDPAANTGNTA